MQETSGTPNPPKYVAPGGVPGAARGGAGSGGGSGVGYYNEEVWVHDMFAVGTCVGRSCFSRNFF